MTEKQLDYQTSMEEFMNYLNRNNYSEETLQGYKKDLEFFYQYINPYGNATKTKIKINDITKNDLLDFMDYGRGKGHSINTIARRISTIKSFYKFLVYEKDYPVDTAQKIRVPKTFVPLPRILTELEVGSLLQAAKKIDLKYEMLFSVMYYTGSRLTAARTLKRKDVSLEQRFLYFSKIKGGRDLFLPLHAQLQALFEQYYLKYRIGYEDYIFPSVKFKERPVSAADVRKKLKLAASMAKIEGRVTPHLLRHCTATHLTIKEVGQVKIANILGHADLRSTMRYQHLSVDHLRGAINKL